MQIAVLGTGMVGKAIANKLASLGHEVLMGTRDPQQTLNKEKDGKKDFQEWYNEQQGIQLLSFESSAQQAALIINCTSGMASLKALQAAGADNLAGKTIIDIANPLDFSQGMPPSLNPVNTNSLGEQIQAAFPKSKVVKTLNTMSVYLMIEPSNLNGDHNVFVSGNDENAKAETNSLLHELGWRPEQIIDLGDITTARGTEMLLPIWLRLWGTLGTAEFNFHIQRN